MFFDNGSSEEIVLVEPVESEDGEHAEESADGDDGGIEGTEEHSFDQRSVLEGDREDWLFIDYLKVLLDLHG